MLSELALRLAVISVLTRAQDEQGNIYNATIAGKYVYDSRQDMISTMLERENQPLIIVYTEDQISTPYSHSNSSPYPNKHMVTLIVELMIATNYTITMQDENGNTITQGSIDVPVTEQQHEATLNLLAAQVRQRLQADFKQQSDREILYKVLMGFDHISSMPSRDDMRGVRLAGRTLKFSAQIKEDQWPIGTFTPSALNGIGLLPKPLFDVVQYFEPASPEYQLCATLAQSLANPFTFAPMDSVTLTDTAYSQSLPTVPPTAQIIVSSSQQ